jgi:uncharacterized protein
MNNKREFHLHNGKSGAAISVHLIPRASRNEIVGIMDNGSIKIRLTAPPVDGQANKALIDFLAKMIDIAPSQIEMISGQTSRNKILTILGLDPTTVNDRIQANIKK